MTATTVGAICDRFPQVLQLQSGDRDTEVSGPSAPTSPQSGSILFLKDPRLIGDAVASSAAVLVVRDSDLENPALGDASQAVLASPNPELALALVARTFFAPEANRQPFAGERIHPSAVIDDSAEIAEDVIVGPNAVVGARTRIDSGTIIGSNTTVESDVSIGEGSHIHPNVYIGYGTQIGKRCEVHPTTALGSEGFGYAHDEQFNHYRHVHYGRLILENDVHVGAGVTIDRGHFRDSIIGSGTRIDNHCHLAHNIQTGKNCLMVADFIAAGTVSIGDNNVFGGRTGVTDHVSIGSNMQFAGMSSVFKDVDEPGQVLGGHPLQPLKDHLRSYATITHLPELRKNVARIMRKLGMT